MKIYHKQNRIQKEISKFLNLFKLDYSIIDKLNEKGIKIYKGKVVADSMDELKSFGDDMRSRMGRGVGVLVAKIDNKVGIVAVVSDDLIKEKKLAAGKIVAELAKIVGGAGGGRPHLATAGGKDRLISLIHQLMTLEAEAQEQMEEATKAMA